MRRGVFTALCPTSGPLRRQTPPLIGVSRRAKQIDSRPIRGAEDARHFMRLQRQLPNDVEIIAE